MGVTTVLVIDFFPDANLAERLMNILQSSLRSATIVLNEVFSEKCDPRDFAVLLSQHDPALCFIILSTKTVLENRALLSTLVAREGKTIVVLVDDPEKEVIIQLLKLGFSDFLMPPLREIEILPHIWRMTEPRTGETTNDPSILDVGLPRLVGRSASFLKEIKKIPVSAKCDASVLITGETGTGKELCARAIHGLSSRALNPFVPVNCGAIPIELVENELFGHESGAFTGAAGARDGILHEANGGTIFLDEIDCLPLVAQVKLLRFLQDKEYRPLGSKKIVKADVRIISASNTNLESAVKDGVVRLDLYYRLNAIPLALPPLRERREDIPLLAKHFAVQYAIENQKKVPLFSPEALGRLMLYDWPGNVRQLEHIIQLAILFCENYVIQAEDIILPNTKSTADGDSFQQAKAKVIAQFESSYIQALLHVYQGNITRAAKAAKKNRRAFWELMRKHQIDAHST